MKTTTKVILGVSAAAAGLYIGTAIAKSYRAFSQERRDAEALDVDHLACYSEMSNFPINRKVQTHQVCVTRNLIIIEPHSPEFAEPSFFPTNRDAYRT